MENVINIELAERAGSKVLIGLAGVSGGGKTYTALQLAYGMVGYNPNKIGLICTENRRGRLNEKIFYPKNWQSLTEKELQKYKFFVGDLLPPFSPKRYIAAIKQFQESGVEVLIIDSVSHEWEGIGGCEEIAEKNMLGGNYIDINTGNKVEWYKGIENNEDITKTGGMPNWALAKKEHKKFMNTMLSSNMHIIACLRARSKSKPGKTKKDDFIDLGIQPITEKNFMFEMTVSLLMKNMGTSQEVLKCPDELTSIMGRTNTYLTSQDGEKLIEWVNGVKRIDPEIKKAKSDILLECEKGVEALKKFGKTIPKHIKDKIGAEFMKTAMLSASEYDNQRNAESQILDTHEPSEPLLLDISEHQSPLEPLAPTELVTTMEQSQVITSAQIKRFNTIAEGNESVIQAILSEFDYTSSNDISVDDYDKMCARLEFEVAYAKEYN